MPASSETVAARPAIPPEPDPEAGGRRAIDWTMRLRAVATLEAELVGHETAAWLVLGSKRPELAGAGRWLLTELEGLSLDLVEPTVADLASALNGVAVAADNLARVVEAYRRPPC